MDTKSSSPHPKKPAQAAIEAYLASLPGDHQRELGRIRELVRAAVPNAEEALVYGLPGFKLNGKALVCYAGFKNHCGFYPMSPAVIQAHLPELKDYEISKGTIRFQPDHPLPKALVKKLVKARADELCKHSA